MLQLEISKDENCSLSIGHPVYSGNPNSLHFTEQSQQQLQEHSWRTMVGYSDNDNGRLRGYGTEDVCRNVCWGALCPSGRSDDSPSCSRDRVQFFHVLLAYASKYSRRWLNEVIYRLRKLLRSAKPVTNASPTELSLSHTPLFSSSRQPRECTGRNFN